MPRVVKPPISSPVSGPPWVSVLATPSTTISSSDASIWSVFPFMLFMLALLTGRARLGRTPCSLFGNTQDVLAANLLARERATLGFSAGDAELDDIVLWVGADVLVRIHLSLLGSRHGCPMTRAA